jgi:hypothetical protein
MADPETEDLAAKYPSVELAYPFAAGSYESALKRFDAVDGKIQSILSLGVTLSLPIPLAGNALQLSFLSFWFMAASLAFLGAVGLGIVARMTGRLVLPDPGQMYTHWLHFPTWEFKKNFIYFAGDHFKRNCDLIDRKAWISGIMSALFALEVVCLVFWVASHL